MNKDFIQIFVFLAVIVTGAFIYKDYFSNKIVWARNGNVRIWTEYFGDSKNKDDAIILVNDAGTVAPFWPDTFCKTLANDRNGNLVIRYDHRDAGNSTHFKEAKTNEPTSYTAQDMVDDLLAVLDTYELKKAYFIGHGMGGNIIQLLMTQEPEICSGAIFINTSPGRTPEIKNALQLSERDPEVDQLLEEHKPTGHFEEDWQAFWQKIITLMNGSEEYDEMLAKKYVKEIYSRDKSNITVTKNHIATYQTYPKNILEDLQKTTIPTLVIHGTENKIVPLDHAKKLVNLLPNNLIKHNVVKIECGHMPFTQKAWDEITEFVIGFLHDYKA